MPRPGTKKAVREAAIAEWWARGPWPCVLLSVDPGTISGASIVVCRPGRYDLIFSEQIRITTRRVEEAIALSVETAEAERLPLVAVLETWGAGGPRSLDSWLGLGEARGVWRRELRMIARDVQALTLSRILLVNMNRWRSRVIEETGVKEPGRAWRRFTSEEWKAAAHAVATDYFLDRIVPPEDAAESACQAVYAMRSDEVLKALSESHLDRYDVPRAHRHELEPIIESGVDTRAA